MKNILNTYTYVAEHIGSTAVKNLRARPIIDIAIGAGNAYDQIAIKDKLTISGYVYDNEKSSLDCFCFHRNIDNKIVFMVYVYIFNSRAWNVAINLRNYLISNAKGREKYENLKLDLYNGVRNDKKQYEKLKKEYLYKEIFPKIYLY